MSWGVFLLLDFVASTYWFFHRDSSVSRGICFSLDLCGVYVVLLHRDSFMSRGFLPRFARHLRVVHHRDNLQTTRKKVITRVLGLTYAPCMDTYTNKCFRQSFTGSMTLRRVQ